jgi:hypothetical protein
LLILEVFLRAILEEFSSGASGISSLPPWTSLV